MKKLLLSCLLVFFAGVVWSSPRQLLSPTLSDRSHYQSPNQKRGVSFLRGEGFYLCHPGTGQTQLRCIPVSYQPGESYILTFKYRSTVPGQQFYALYYTPTVPGLKHWYLRQSFNATDQWQSGQLEASLPGKEQWGPRQLHIVFAIEAGELELKDISLTIKERRRNNLLDGDTDFETGAGSWIYSSGEEQLRAISGDGAFGQGCLETDSRSWLTMCGYQRNLLQPDRPHVFSFYARSPKSDSVKLIAGIRNQNYRVVGEKSVTITSQWQRYEIPIPPAASCEFGFAYFQVQGKNPVRIDAVQLEAGTKATPYAAAEANSVAITTGFDGEVVVVDHPGALPVLDCRVFSAKEEGNRQLHLEIPGVWQQQLSFQSVPGVLSSWRIPVIAARQPGYYMVKYALKDAAGNTLTQGIAPFVVTTPFSPDYYKNGFCGLQRSRTPLTALRRIGCAVLRADGSRWRDVEPAQGQFRQANDMSAYPGFRVIAMTGEFDVSPQWSRQPGSTLPKDGALAGPFFQVAAQAGAKNAVFFDIQNEPNLSLTRAQGGTYAKAIELQIQLLKAAAPHVRAAGSKVMLNGSGESQSFVAKVLSQAGNSVDILGDHPYPTARGTINQQNEPYYSPESSDLREKIQQGINAANSVKPAIGYGIGELGWCVDYRLEATSMGAQYHAAYLARTFLLARSFPQCQFLVWFSSGPNLPEHGWQDYSLWRNKRGLSPMPAVAAYATIAHLFQDGKHFQLHLDDQIKVLGWQRGEKHIFAVWNSDDRAPVTQITLPAQAQVTNLYGTPSGNLLKLNYQPQYITVNEADAPQLLKLLKERSDAMTPVKAKASLVAPKRLRITLQNLRSKPISGHLQLGECRLAVSLAANGIDQVEVPLAAPVTGLEQEFTASWQEPNGQAQPLRLVIPPTRPIYRLGKRDWRTYDFTRATSLIKLESRNNIQPPDPGVGWQGVNDLSMQALFAWDEQHLYLFAKVKDDIHRNPYSQGQIWRGDVLQLAIDSRNDAAFGKGYQRDDYEFGFALEKDSWRWHGGDGAGKAPVTIQSQIQRQDGQTIYRIAIPWSELNGLSPAADSVLGASIKVNDLDRDSPSFYLNYGLGISGAQKDPGQFRKHILSSQELVHE